MDTPPRRFHIPPEICANVTSYAHLSAKQIRSLELYVEGYTQWIADLGELVRGGPPPPDESIRDALVLQRSQLDQLASTRDELIQLAEDAKTEGTEALRTRSLKLNPNVELMSLPDPSEPVALGASLAVVQDRIRRECRDVADRLMQLVAWLERAPDPEALVFSEQLTRLADKIRPPNVPPGPYAKKPPGT